MFDVVNSFTVVTYDVFPFPVAGALGRGEATRVLASFRFQFRGLTLVKSPSAAPSRYGSLCSVGVNVSVVYSPAVPYLSKVPLRDHFVQ